jgi:hypothetical protein
MKGTKFSRLLFQLQPKTHRTEEIDVGLLLKTPCSADAYTEGMSKKEQKFGNSGTLAQEVQTGFIYQRGMLPTPRAAEFPNSKDHIEKGKIDSLVTMANLGLLPTPTVMDSTNATATMKSTQVKEGSMHSVTLTRAMAMGMLPTPQAQEGEKITGLENQDSMTKRVRQITGKTSQLNPRFVAEMMGFPPNWTELPFQSGEQNQSKDTAMP